MRRIKQAPPGGAAIECQRVSRPRSVRAALDQGRGLVQEVLSRVLNSFSEEAFSHPSQEIDLEILKQARIVERMVDWQVYLHSFPEQT
jgi:hypothetical protein